MICSRQFSCTGLCFNFLEFVEFGAFSMSDRHSLQTDCTCHTWAQSQMLDPQLVSASSNFSFFASLPYISWSLVSDWPLANMSLVYISRSVLCFINYKKLLEIDFFNRTLWPKTSLCVTPPGSTQQGTSLHRHKTFARNIFHPQ